PPHRAPVGGVPFAPGGEALLTIAGGSAILWDPRAGARLRSFASPSAVLAAAFDRDGRRVAIAGADGVARLFAVEPGRPPGPSIRHGGPILHVRFLPGDGGTLLTASGDRTARLWHADTGRPAGAVIPMSHRPARRLP